MIDYSTGKPMTAHTTNEVPFVYVSKDAKDKKLKSDGILADIAPTMLTEMSVEIPEEMTGRNLIQAK
ncbi:phosphoglyceromutase [Clostridium tetani 12124569]|nr:phosphoglyceromutase [Clostridium tetani 12124569]